MPTIEPLVRPPEPMRRPLPSEPPARQDPIKTDGDLADRWEPAALHAALTEAIAYAEAFYLVENTGAGSSLVNASISTLAELSRGATEILELGTGTAEGWSRIEEARDGWDYAIGVAHIAKDLGLAAGTILAALGVTGRLRVVSKIKESPGLVREAERAGRSHQRSLDHLVDELRRGNLNAGSGSKWLDGAKGTRESRAQDGARVYFRVKEELIEILGKSNKNNQESVIRLMKKAFDL